MQKRGEIKRLDFIEESLKARINELTALYEVSRSITSAVNLDRMLRLVARKVAAIMKADVCTIHLLDGGKLSLYTLTGTRKEFRHGLNGPLPVRGGVTGAVMQSQSPCRVGELLKDRRGIFYKIATREGLHSLLMVPLIGKGHAIGVLTILSKRRWAYTYADEEELSLFASQAAMAIENAKLFEELRINYLNTVKLLASMIDAKDAYTENHSERVMRSALGIANTLNLSGTQKSIIKYSSLLHDIGKISIDIGILRKPAPLTEKEWQRIKEHPKTGAEILKKAGFLDELIPTILYHHVRYSGGGYPPTAKKRTNIPIEARILAVADSYEAMVSDRPYRRHLTKEQAADELKRCSGTQFDPKVVKAFLKYLKK